MSHSINDIRCAGRKFTFKINEDCTLVYILDKNNDVVDSNLSEINTLEMSNTLIGVFDAAALQLIGLTEKRIKGIKVTQDEQSTFDKHVQSVVDFGYPFAKLLYDLDNGCSFFEKFEYVAADQCFYGSYNNCGLVTDANVSFKCDAVDMTYTTFDNTALIAPFTRSADEPNAQNKKSSFKDFMLQRLQNCSDVHSIAHLASLLRMEDDKPLYFDDELDESYHFYQEKHLLKFIFALYVKIITRQVRSAHNTTKTNNLKDVIVVDDTDPLISMCKKIIFNKDSLSKLTDHTVYFMTTVEMRKEYTHTIQLKTKKLDDGTEQHYITIQRENGDYKVVLSDATNPMYSDRYWMFDIFNTPLLYALNEYIADNSVDPVMMCKSEHYDGLIVERVDKPQCKEAILSYRHDDATKYMHILQLDKGEHNNVAYRCMIADLRYEKIYADTLGCTNAPSGARVINPVVTMIDVLFDGTVKHRKCHPSLCDFMITMGRVCNEMLKDGKTSGHINSLFNHFHFDVLKYIAMMNTNNGVCSGYQARTVPPYKFTRKAANDKSPYAYDITVKETSTYLVSNCFTVIFDIDGIHFAYSDKEI